MKVRQNNLLIETEQKNTKSDCITDFAPPSSYNLECGRLIKTIGRSWQMSRNVA